MNLLDRLRPNTKPKTTVDKQTDAAHIAYDRASMIIDGKRTVIRGGAFHYYRLPAPELWRDRLLKIKRSGYNTVDLYFFWGYHSPADGVYDFSGLRDVSRVLSLCDELGLYVIARPGPFINSEVDGGGHPAWLLAKEDIPLRSLKDGEYVDSPAYQAYTRQWYEQIVSRILGHPSVILFQIENEYVNRELNPAYMNFLRDLVHELGVNVPLIHNDLFKQGCWNDIVDIYGVDEYAVTAFSSEWRGNPATLIGLDGLGEIKEKYCVKGPLAIYELQGGWFDPWDGIGYDEVRRRLGRENMNIVTWSPLAQGATIYSHYMFAGGTNWDHVGAPPVHTSYDFAAPIYEWGGVSERYHAARAIASVVQAFEDVFALSEPCDDVQAGDPALLYKARRQGDARIAFLRNFSGQERSTTLRAAAVETGPVTVAPWDMRVAFLNLPFVNARVTSSCNIFTGMHHDNQHLIVFYGPGRVSWTLPTPCRLLSDELQSTAGGSNVEITYNGKEWKDVVFSSGGHRYRSLFVPSADEVWLNGEFLILGASYTGSGRMKGGVTDLPRYEMQVQTTGPKEKTIRIYTVGSINRVQINDEMTFASSETIASYLRFEMPRPPEVALPALGPWRIKPVLESDRVQAEWRALPAGNSLEMDKLGIYQGFACYRAAYKGAMASIGLAIRHHAAVYLNGRFVAKLDNYQSEANDSQPESADVPPLAVALPAALQNAAENTLTVVVESLGHNKGFLGNERLPRGILGIQADRPLAWSVRAGLAAEADVTALACNDSAWAQAADLAAAPDEDMLWARTHFALDLPKNAYAPIGLQFDGIVDKAHIYLNSLLIARDWSMCKHRRFYLPEGLLKTHGDNLLTLLLWRRGGRPAAGTVELKTYVVEASNFVNVL